MLAAVSAQGNFVVYENSTKVYKRDDMVLEDGELNSTLAATAKLDIVDAKSTNHSKGDSMGSCKT